MIVLFSSKLFVPQPILFINNKSIYELTVHHFQVLEGENEEPENPELSDEQRKDNLQKAMTWLKQELVNNIF